MIAPTGFRPRFAASTIGCLLALCALPARATFHLMQIEQVIGGVCGDTTLQAIQLRMRFSGQNEVGGTSLVAHDAAGANPITLLTIPNDVLASAAGTRILLATVAFQANQSPPADFTLTNAIPASYLDAGRLTFQAGATIYWSLAWGGASYTGSHAGATDNDNNTPGNFGPADGSELPSTGSQALVFPGAASAESTSNLVDYGLTAGGAVFRNSSGGVGAALDCVLFGDGFESGGFSAWSRKEP